MNHFILYITHLLLPICIIICSVSTSFAQLTELQLSTRIVFSDVTGRNDFNERIIDANTWKYSKGLSLGANFNIWKNRLSLRTNLFYNERKALEFFTFGVEGTPDLEQYPFLSRRFTFLRWASSPQSDLFYNENFEHPFIHFPNFKYLHLELLPIYTFSIGEKWSIQSGVGISGGILLNRAENTIGREYFPAFDELFESGMLVGEVEYHRYDVNVMGQLGVRYRVSPALSVGISSGVHHSLIHLNDSFRESISRQVNWLIITPGIDVVYHLKRDDGGE